MVWHLKCPSNGIALLNHMVQHENTDMIHTKRTRAKIFLHSSEPGDIIERWEDLGASAVPGRNCCRRDIRRFCMTVIRENGTWYEVVCFQFPDIIPGTVSVVGKNWCLAGLVCIIPIPWSPNFSILCVPLQLLLRQRPSLFPNHRFLAPKEFPTQRGSSPCNDVSKSWKKNWATNEAMIQLLSSLITPAETNWVRRNFDEGFHFEAALCASKVRQEM